MEVLNSNLIGRVETKKENETSSGFIERSNPSILKVEVLGSKEPEIPVGSKVLIKFSSGQDEDIDGEELRIFHRTDVIRIL